MATAIAVAGGPMFYAETGLAAVRQKIEAFGAVGFDYWQVNHCWRNPQRMAEALPTGSPGTHAPLYDDITMVPAIPNSPLRTRP
jgi:hypothetical protein